jgi:alpha-amylase
MGDEKVSLVDINTERDDVVKQYQEWIPNFVQEYGIDGLRIDAAKHIRHDFWSGFCGAAGVFCIGEVFGPDVKWVLVCFYERKTHIHSSLSASYQGPLDSVLNFPLYYGMVSAFGNPDATNITALTSVIAESQKTFKVPIAIYSTLEILLILAFFIGYRSPGELFGEP